MLFLLSILLVATIAIIRVYGERDSKSVIDGQAGIWMNLLVLIWIACTLIILFMHRSFINQTTELFFDGHWESGLLNEEGPNGEEFQSEATAFIPSSEKGLVFKRWVGKGLLPFLILTTILGYLALPKYKEARRPFR